MFVIPTSKTLSDYVQTTELDGRAYRLHFQWNGRLARWALNVATESGDPIVNGILVVSNVPLLRKVADSRAPGGFLGVQSVDGEPPGLFDFHPGGRCRLVYFTEAEVNGTSI